MSFKIFYVGMQNDYGDDSRPRSYEYIHIYESLVEYGFDCQFYDYMKNIKKIGFEKLQQDLLGTIQKFSPDLVIFSLYEDQISEETIKLISNDFKTFALFFDDIWRKEFVFKYGNVVDHFTSTDFYGQEEYKEKVKGKAHYFTYGFNPKYFYRSSEQKIKYNYDVSFVGSWSASRQWVVDSLKKSGIKVEAFGYGWDNGVVDHEKMLNIFQTSKINLNLSNSVQSDISCVFSSLRALKNYFVGKKTGEHLKGRHLEINASGGFQLTCFADGLSSLYDIHKEIEVYTSLENLKEKVSYFLLNDRRREEVARRGHQKAQQYKYIDVLIDLFYKMNLLSPGQEVINNSIAKDNTCDGY